MFAVERFRSVGKRSEAVQRGVIDEDVHPSRFGKEAERFARAREVRLQHPVARRTAGERVYQRFGFNAGVPAVQQEPRSRRGEGAGKLRAHPPGSAGNQYKFLFNPHIFPRSLLKNSIQHIIFHGAPESKQQKEGLS